MIHRQWLALQRARDSLTAKPSRATIPRRPLTIVMVFVLMGGIAWANPPASETTNAPTSDVAGSADPVPFDPFDNPGGDSYGDKELLLQAVADPIEGINRAMFVFNDKLYFWVLKPVASGYRVVVPTPGSGKRKRFFFLIFWDRCDWPIASFRGNGNQRKASSADSWSIARQGFWDCSTW